MEATPASPLSPQTPSSVLQLCQKPSRASGVCWGESRDQKGASGQAPGEWQLHRQLPGAALADVLDSHRVSHANTHSDN